jgi:hypothetical protein
MLTEKFRVITLPVGSCGDFTVQMFDDTTKVTVDGYMASMKLEKWVVKKKF